MSKPLKIVKSPSSRSSSSSSGRETREEAARSDAICLMRDAMAAQIEREIKRLTEDYNQLTFNPFDNPTPATELYDRQARSAISAVSSHRKRYGGEEVT